MDQSEAVRFKRIAIKSKKELIRAVDDFIYGLEDEERSCFVAKSRIASVKSLMKTFKEKIESSDLRFLDGPFQQYEITITDIDIFLDIVDYKELVFDIEGNIDSATSEVGPEILSVRAFFIPLNEYASMQKVKASTVLQWIKRGKIRNVEKRDSGWFIASTQGKPSREFDSGTFVCERDSGDLSDISSLAKGTKRLAVCKGARLSEKGGVGMDLYDSDECLIERMSLDDGLYREIEESLLAATNVIFESTYISAITEKAPLKIGGQPAIDTTMDQVESALSYIEMSDKSRVLFDLIVNSIKSEELLLTALQELGLESALKEGIVRHSQGDHTEA